MTSIIAGGGLGLFGSSYTQVNGYGATGKAKIGQGNDGAYVNASTGNLVINAQDEFVSAYGLSDALTRTYNSLPNAEGYNLDQWQFSFERSLSVGVAPTTLHGNITRTTADGDVETFVYNAALQNGLGGWQSKNGSGTYDQIYAVTSSSISILAKLFGVVAVGGYNRWCLRRASATEADRIAGIEKPPDLSVRGFCLEPGSVLLSHDHCHTTIGAELFHFRVRDGNGWFQLAMAARQTVWTNDFTITNPNWVVVKHHIATSILTVAYVNL